MSKRISEFIQRTPDGTEFFEVIIPPFSAGTNRKVLLSDILAMASGAVDSVNGETGVVVLDANDVGADPSGSAATVASNLSTHIADSSAAHAASAISFSPTGSISATDVQAAIAEVAAEAGASISFATAAEISTGSNSTKVISPSGLTTTLADFIVLTDAAPVVFDCALAREPKGYLETAVNRTFDLQNVRGDGVLNAYSAIVIIIKKTTASDVIITLDTGYTNKDLLTDATVTSYTLTGAINTYHKITALVLGQASGAFIWWNQAATVTLSIPLTTGSIFVGVSGVATAKALSGEFDASTGTVSLAALGITTAKIANDAVTFAKILGPTGLGENVMTNDNAGDVAAPYPIVNGTITDSTVIAALLLETSWAGDTKTIANTLEGQSYKGTGSTGVTYFYYCTVDGTVIRIITGEGVPITDIQIPPCTEITGTSTSMAKNNAYVANNASRVSLLLPASAAVGDIVEVTGKGAGGWRITQAAGQTIRHATNTTTGTGGYIESNAAQYSAVKLKCITANTDWVIQNVQGAITTV